MGVPPTFAPKVTIRLKKGILRLQIGLDGVKQICFADPESISGKVNIRHYAYCKQEIMTIANNKFVTMLHKISR